jgi:uncharacterized damage-inducible protein DinB
MAINSMSKDNSPEVWQRGPIEGIPSLLQPVAHVLLQAQEEIHAMMHSFPADLLWNRPADVASVAFHLQHIPGVWDRLFTYAEGKQLSAEQLDYKKKEGQPDTTITGAALLNYFDQRLEKVITTLKNTDPAILTEARTVGRDKLPSTVLGLFFHAAEHTMRHAGQLLVTIRVLKENSTE